MTSIKDILKGMGYMGYQGLSVQASTPQPQPVDSSKPPKGLTKTQQYLWAAGYRGIGQ